MNHLKIFLLLMLPLVLAGCAGKSAERTPAPAMPALTPPQPYTEPEAHAANPGSIFSESSSGMLFEDSRARRVGDIILIKIVENTKASNKANTTTQRQSEVNYGISAAFGRNTVSPLFVGGFMSSPVGSNPIVSANSENKHEATGQTTRENSVSTTIGGRVINVLPNGILEVAGAREIKVNAETEYMVIKGLVRGSDVLSDNSILSTQLADSSIEYYGKGALAEKQGPGWLSRLLDTVWPF
ncbi:MAG: flagellar basal body L-ring protein FlgH [Deltaproteobacteria bacterium]|jgi:flagellar L-ring protein precursor FlgH|nr:flagellar basal body L-ring protein FlgH [Deltaproteobacteria bacterium]